MVKNTPFALARRIVPRNMDIIRLDWGAFLRELLAYFCDQLIEFGFIDGGDSIDE